MWQYFKGSFFLFVTTSLIVGINFLSASAIIYSILLLLLIIIIIHYILAIQIIFSLPPILFFSLSSPLTRSISKENNVTHLLLRVHLCGHELALLPWLNIFLSRSSCLLELPALCTFLDNSLCKSLVNL